MQFAFICLDTHGGVQPYVALALGLQRAGHDARLLAPKNFSQFVTSRGVRFCPLSGDIQAFMKSPEFVAVAHKGFLAVQKLAMRKISEIIGQCLPEAVDACAGVDVIVAGVGGFGLAETTAEQLKVRFIQAHLQPLTPTNAIPGPLAPAWLSRLGGIGHRLGNTITRQLLWQPMRTALSTARRTLFGLPPAPFWSTLGQPAGDSPVLYGYSSHVIPCPPDWGRHVHVTGYWFLDDAASYVPPPGLMEFLAAGAPPIVVGFGSMADRDSKATARLIVAAVRKAGVRAVLLSGWAGMDSTGLDPSVYAIDSVPHDWLYPRAALVVHHGGAGTTGAVFRAGLPGVVVPFAAEQPFWGRQVHSLGCGPKPLLRSRLTADGLAEAIQEGLREPIRQRARAVGELVRAEDGVGNAVQHLTA